MGNKTTSVGKDVEKLELLYILGFFNFCSFLRKRHPGYTILVRSPRSTLSTFGDIIPLALAFMIADEKVAASLIVVPLIDKLLFLFGCRCCYYYDYDDDHHPSFMSFSFTMKCLDVYYFYFYNYLGFLLLFLHTDCFSPFLEHSFLSTFTIQPLFHSLYFLLLGSNIVSV